MRCTRRRFTIAGGALLTAPACTPGLPTGTPTTTEPTMTTSIAPHLQHRALSTLPTTKLSWLSLRDHFVATVGAQAGRGRPLGDLLVLADATFVAGSRFPLHPHEEMEILSIVLDGELSHHGDQAHGATIPARHAQLISARDGMVHAEGNDTASPVRMLQIWFRPRTHGGPPAYFETAFETPGHHVVASGDGSGGLPLRSDARVEWVDVAAGAPTRFTVGNGRAGYLLALTEPVRAGGAHVGPGEGLVVGGGDVDVLGAGPVLWIDVAI